MIFGSSIQKTPGTTFGSTDLYGTYCKGSCDLRGLAPVTFRSKGLGLELVLNFRGVVSELVFGILLKITGVVPTSFYNKSV